MNDMTEFVNARLDEVEALARKAQPWPPLDEVLRPVLAVRNPLFVAQHIARHDPAQVLREVEAKRKIIALHAHLRVQPSYCDTCSIEFEWPCPTLHHLAAVYSDHPDYRQEWA